MHLTHVRSAALAVLLLSPHAHAQGYSPAQAVHHMAVPKGFQVSLVASEPDVRQPVAIGFDDRGRLWVVQYLQYPNPAGLKRVQVDRYSRTIYDKLPDPPPHGVKGSDRITIFEDTDGDGRADAVKDFVSGLNLASGIAFGHGGVFVLNVPYLLFYPDKDRDDVPDADPEVLLSGFGMEDAHAVANSLTWGPDGWLYGCQGSTVTAKIRGIEFQQGVWRYHPLTKKFELFCEGGGNSWGLDFDANGQLIYSTNFGPAICLHGVQGGYYWKSFGKHGALHNPHTYGYFDHVPHTGAKGGHVTDGGIIYQGTLFPERFRGKYIANNLLAHDVYWHELSPIGSTFTSRHEGELLVANDTWFAPTDLTMGPDGAIYVADWCDKRTAHPDPDAEWDRTNGRIYRVYPLSETEAARPLVTGGAETSSRTPDPKAAVRDLRLASTPDLITTLRDPNEWYVRRALRILAERRDPEAIEPLCRIALDDADDHVALRAVWALNQSGGLDERTALKLLEHRSPHIRAWVVRLEGDQGKLPRTVVARLTYLAAKDPSPVVRSQLASTAQRLSAPDALPVIRLIASRNEDAADPHIPLLLWWALERFAISDEDRIVSEYSSPSAWREPLTREFLLPRLARRYAAQHTDAGYASCARMIHFAPADADRLHLLAAVDQALEGQTLAAPPAPLKTELDRLWRPATSDLTLIRIAARLGYAPAAQRAEAIAIDKAAPAAIRIAALAILGEAGPPACVSALLRLIDPSNPEVTAASLRALQRFSEPYVAPLVLNAYPRLNTGLRAQARDLLCGRKPWALTYLQAIEQGTFPRDEVTPAQLSRLALHHDEQIDALVQRLWGKFHAATPEEKLAEVRRLNNDLRAARGDADRGRPLFTQHCANCHRLFDEGKNVGPDLTQANRKDRDFLLVSIVDPSTQIRKEYANFIVETASGQIHTGLIADQTPMSVTLLAANEERVSVARQEIKELRESDISLMPEDLLNKMKPQELRDLFAYLQSDAPPSRENARGSDPGAKDGPPAPWRGSSRQ